MSQTFLQSHCLDGQDLLTALCAGLFIRWNKRLLWKCSCQECLCLFNCKRNTYQSLFIQRLERCILSSLACDSLKIQLRVNDFIYISTAFFQNCPIFSNDIVSAKNKICRRFTFSCIRINVSGDQSCRLSGDQCTTVCIFSNRLITCGTVDDHCCTFECCLNARRDR